MSLAGASRGGAAELLRLQPLPPAAARGHLHRPEPGGGSGGAGLGGAPAQAVAEEEPAAAAYLPELLQPARLSRRRTGLRPHGAHSAAPGVPAGNRVRMHVIQVWIQSLESDLKGLVHPKMNMCLCFTHPQGMLGVYDFLLPDELY